jgi:hypothetical protein
MHVAFISGLMACRAPFVVAELGSDADPRWSGRSARRRLTGRGTVPP